MPASSTTIDSHPASAERMQSSVVSVSKLAGDDAAYPERAPYDPPQPYPELGDAQGLDTTNRVYPAVRDALQLAALDAEGFGTANWNPFEGIVRPGDKVFLKPNMIAHRHALRDEWRCVITHGAVLRPILDYVAIALDGRGRIMIGDGPQTDSHWDRIVEHMGLRELAAYVTERYGVHVELIDLRDEYWVEEDGIYTERHRLGGDPRGRTVFDLGADSEFAEWDGADKRYYGAFYDVDETNRHHHQGRHEYAISRTPLEANVFINVPKFKTHKKCGLTVNLKSVVGINADKNWLPHYVIGGPDEGGDQFDRSSGKSRLENRLVLAAKRILLREGSPMQWMARRLKETGYRLFGDTEEVVRSGNWHGNDTVWRMCLDLNRILMYGTASGEWRTSADPKRFFSVVDGIVAMEGNGPVAGTARQAGVVVAGANPVSVDAVCAAVMGFDWQHLPLIRAAHAPHRFPLAASAYDMIEVRSHHAGWHGNPSTWQPDETLGFTPPFGWRGACELADEVRETQGTAGNGERVNRQDSQ